MAAVLSADLDKTDKIANLIEDCKAMGLEILPPNINRSIYRFKVDQGAIRYGLGAVKGVGRRGGVRKSGQRSRTPWVNSTPWRSFCRESIWARSTGRTLGNADPLPGPVMSSTKIGPH